MYDAMADGLLVIDSAGTVVFANASATALLGRNPAALVGSPVRPADRRPADFVVGPTAPATPDADRALQPGDRVLEMRVARSCGGGRSRSCSTSAT